MKINNREQNFEYQPTQKQIQKLLSEFNSQSQNGEYFELKNVQIIDLDVKNEEVKNEEVNQINNEIVFIYGDLNYDSPYKKLSPLYGSTKNDFFIVDNLYYPNISIYISTCLLANQGMAIDHKKKLVYKRGMTIRDARSLLIIRPKEQLIYKEKIEGPKDMITNVIIDEQGFQHYYENQNIDEKTNSFYLPGDADFICKKVEIYRSIFTNNSTMAQTNETYQNVSCSDSKSVQEPHNDDIKCCRLPSLTMSTVYPGYASEITEVFGHAASALPLTDLE